MNPPTSTPTPLPPPLPPPTPGLGRVLAACLLPAVIVLVTTLLGFRNAPIRNISTLIVGVSFLVPAWAAWDLHQRRRALGKNVMSNPWLAAGAGLLGGIVFTVGATVVALAILVLVLFGVCALSGGKIGG